MLTNSRSDPQITLQAKGQKARCDPMGSFDPIWFAVIMTVNLEIGLVTPPVGLNLYIVKTIAPDIPMSRILLGVIPFIIIEILVIILVTIWPELALWLPNKMIG